MILIIYQKCLESGEVLAYWKLVSITAVYRKDVREHPERELNLYPMMLTLPLTFSVSLYV